MRGKYFLAMTSLIIMALLVFFFQQQILSYLIFNSDLYDLVYVKNETLSFESETAPRAQIYEQYDTSISFSWNNLNDKTIIKISVKPDYNWINGYFILPLEIKDNLVNYSINNYSLKIFDRNNNKELIIEPSLSTWHDSYNVEFEIDHTIFEQYNELPLNEEDVSVQVEPFLVYKYAIWLQK